MQERTKRKGSELQVVGHQTERDLVLSYQSGQDDAYSEIYRRYRPMVEHISRRLLKNPDDAEEATQEAMLRVLQGLGRFNGRYLLQAWVARIATNVCLDVLRGKSRHPEVVEHAADEAGEVVPTLHAAPSADPSEDVERAFEGDEVREVLHQLPDHHRDALVMRTMGGLSHEEMAERMEMSPAQVKALIHRAKGSFRRAWSGDGRGFGLLLPAFLWRIPMPKFLRRALFGADGASGAAGAAASPSMVAATTTVGPDRLVAAMTAVIVGTAGVGMVAARNHSSPPPKQPAVIVVEQPSFSRGTSVLAPRATRPHKRAAKSPRVLTTPVPEVAAPTPDPTETPSPVPTPEAPSPSPAPSPTEDPTTGPPTPQLDPEPSGFAMGFQVDATTDYRCGCSGIPSEDSTVRPHGDEPAPFSEHVVGVAKDASGAEAWHLDLVQSSSDGWDHSMHFVLDGPGGSYYYDSAGRLQIRDRNAWGGWRHVYSGTYSRSSSPTSQDDMPRQGTYTVEVQFSAAGDRIVSITVTLNEAS